MNNIFGSSRINIMIRASATLTACLLITACYIEESTVPTAPSQPAINYFTADITSVASGEEVNLNWDVTDADSITIEPGIGTVSQSGTYKVTPSSSTVYVLTAINKAGEVTAKTSIQVTPASQSPECISVSCDPVTGRNADISFRWEQISLCTEYQIQIAKDPRFTMLIYDRQQYTPYSVTSPGLVYLAGGILECGHTYYLRIRCTGVATGQRIRSPWSILGCLTINSGLPIGGANK